MHGMNADEEIEYWRIRAKRAEQQLADKHEQLAAAVEVIDNTCERCQERCPHRVSDRRYTE